MQNFEELKSSALQQISAVQNREELEQARLQIFGKNAPLTLALKGLGTLQAEERKATGALLNVIRGELTQMFDDKKALLEQQELEEKLNHDVIDVSLPVAMPRRGRIHPVEHVLAEMMTIYNAMGFDIADGPDIEDDWHNFEALNIPPSHPARQMQDTFYLKNSPYLLRTQTSGIQIRTMEEKGVPVKIVAPGRCYRVDSDATHSPLFHQIEGLFIDKDITLAHLKSVLEDSLRLFFETPDLIVRFRPSYFPFTEPSFEFDIGGKLAQDIGKQWLELGGCGMVDPAVLQNCHIDPELYQGFAFGFGVDRCAMLKYGIPDIRSFFEGDMRWSAHYGFMPEDVPTMTTGLSLNGGSKR